MLFKLSCPHLFSAADAAADADAAAAAAAAYSSRNHSIPKTSFGGIQLYENVAHVGTCETG